MFLVFFLTHVATGHLSSQRGHCVMAAPFAPPRFFAAWRVEGTFSAVSLYDGLYILRSLWLDT